MENKKFAATAEVLVRFVDADMMGHVNNAHYLTYLEQGRVAYFEKLFDKAAQFPFIIAEISIKFISPAFFNETLVIGVRTAEFRTKAFGMEYEIFEKNTHRLIATATSVQVMFDYKKNVTFPIPEELKSKMIQLF